MWLQDSPTHSHMLTSNTKSSTCGNLARSTMNVNLISFVAASGSCHSGHSQWMKTELSTDGFDLRMFLNHWLSRASKVEALHLPARSYPGSAVHHPMMLHVVGWLTGTNNRNLGTTVHRGWRSSTFVAHQSHPMNFKSKFRLTGHGTWDRTQVTTWARTQVRVTWGQQVQIKFQSVNQQLLNMIHCAYWLWFFFEFWHTLVLKFESEP